MIGDRAPDIRGGHANGTRTAAALWGYGSEAELAAAEPDALLRSPAEYITIRVSSCRCELVVRNKVLIAAIQQTRVANRGGKRRLQNDEALDIVKVVIKAKAQGAAAENLPRSTIAQFDGNRFGT